ncbi:MAG: NAD(P)-dependent oxidoreductase [Bryobacterales bacterium]|nr:NAD(P)-dependent oxidoreductase [Bryobacteraceae bacterium]MDW8353540.1 NAD(P)-dependent oxidoreductase [Bryobacterales bacterium]
MARLGFLGLGIMGYPMARNLLRAGHEVALWSHTAAKARQLAAAEKGVFCETPRQVGEFAECSFLCVGDTEMSERVILGPDGVAAGARPGAVIVDCGTISPDRSRRIGQELAQRGLHLLDAPCTGSRPGAEGGTLTFMIGGDREVFERVRPFFEPMGKRLYYCGGPGMGLHAKLTQNLILCNIMQAFCEGIVLSTKAGVDPRLMLDILSNSAAKCGLIEFKAPYILRRDFGANFSLKWMHKDIELMLESGKQLGVPLPLTSLTQQMFRAAMAIGNPEADFCSAIRVLEQWAGVEVRAGD